MSVLVENKDKIREKRLALAQQQLILYQQYGQAAAYGFETMDTLRQLLLDLSLDVEESYEDSVFSYALGGKDLCLVNWHKHGVQMFIYPGSQDGDVPVILEYHVGENVDWMFIKEKLKGHL